MSSKFEPQTLCAGMRVGTEFLSQFTKALVRNGGSEFLIWFMTLEKSAERLEELAKFAVAQHYPVPYSLIKKLALEHWASEDQGTEWNPDEDSDFSLDVVRLEQTFGIPVERFNFETNPLTAELRSQILGQTYVCPFVVQHRGEPHLVVQLYSSDYERPKRGETIEGFTGDDEWELRLAPAKYFDLDN